MVQLQVLHGEQKKLQQVKMCYEINKYAGDNLPCISKALCEVQLMFDSYMTLEEVEEIRQVVIPAGSIEDKVWDSLTAAAKLRSILLATNLLENTLMFVGRRFNKNQGFQFPRVYNGRIINLPDEYKMGIVLQAVKTVTASGSEKQELIGSGVKSYEVEGASISFFDNAYELQKDKNGVYKDVYNLVQKYAYQMGE